MAVSGIIEKFLHWEWYIEKKFSFTFPYKEGGSPVDFGAQRASRPDPSDILNPPAKAWRYRLGVRTEDSQSSNPGSIPGSATNSDLSRPAFSSTYRHHLAKVQTRRNTPWGTSVAGVAPRCYSPTEAAPLVSHS